MAWLGLIGALVALALAVAFPLPAIAVMLLGFGIWKVMSS